MTTELHSPAANAQAETDSSDHTTEVARRNEWRMHGKYAGFPLSHPIAQQGIMRQFFRVWCPLMSLAERNVLGFILDSTVNWGERSRRFTHKYIEAVAGVKKSQSYDVLKLLHAKGVLYVDSDDVNIYGTMIYVNLEWEPKAEIAGPSPPPLRMRTRPNTDSLH